jgi:hypothetical protein
MLSFVINTGIQYHRLENVTLDLNANVINALRFYEYQIKDKVYIEPVYYFPEKDKYLRRQELIYGGYLNKVTNEIVPEEVINPMMNWLDVDNLLSVNRLDVTLGKRKVSALELMEGKWLPMPLLQNDSSGLTDFPTNWCRIKLLPKKDQSTNRTKVYDILLALDTREMAGKEGPRVEGRPFQEYSICGYSREYVDSLIDSTLQKRLNTVQIPIKAYDFCSMDKQPWLNPYLQTLFECEDYVNYPTGQKMKYLAYYMYFICYIQKLGIIPDIRLYSDKENTSIPTNLIIDVGNSRTYGIVAEEPLDISWSKAAQLQIHDLETGDGYREAFDMRLCFKEENFGLTVNDSQFKWPSLVRLGKEAIRTIYNGGLDLVSEQRFDTNYSSPKRYLWDTKMYDRQWKFISEKNRFVGPAKTVCMEGLTQQFRNDGSFTPNPSDMGDKYRYSRSSLMTFCFIEILLQARMQINGVDFRTNNGNPQCKREISRVILTCPTAMPRQEQIRLRKCMEEATIVLKRYYSKTYGAQYYPEADLEKVEIVPSVKDLSRIGSNADNRRHWSFDEATCCQMVFMYSELRRYLGNTQEFFDIYGKSRISAHARPNEENTIPKRSLTVASLDIGAGTSDIMICNYENLGVSIRPKPLFWESFQLAGDDLIKRIIKDVLLEPQVDSEHSGVIARKLKSTGCPNVSDKMHEFFGSGQSLHEKEQRMRKEFNIQVMIPIAQKLLDLLQKNEPDCTLSYGDFFPDMRPSDVLMDYFAGHMGFRFESLTIRFEKEYLNSIICRVFETTMRQWAAIFYRYKCDIVLLGGRPCSLQQVYTLMRRLYPVSPNRLISMNSYRVGSWYVGSSGSGRFSDDKKSLVSVGALIAYLAEAGKLPMMRINTDYLKTDVKPTSDYIGIMGQDGSLVSFLSPEENYSDVKISALPVNIGTKQLNVSSYSTQMLYILDFNNAHIHEKALENVRQAMHLPESTPESDMPGDSIRGEEEMIRMKAFRKTPLTFSFERDFYEDKEAIKITSVENCDRDTIGTKLFSLHLQSWSEDISNWLDSGVFSLFISL